MSPSARYTVDSRAHTLAPGVLLLIAREGGGPVELAEDDALALGSTPGRVLALDGDAAMVLFGARAWVISPLRPDELAWQRREYRPGTAEWVVRAPFG